MKKAVAVGVDIPVNGNTGVTNAAVGGSGIADNASRILAVRGTSP